MTARSFVSLSSATRTIGRLAGFASNRRWPTTCSFSRGGPVFIFPTYRRLMMRKQRLLRYTVALVLSVPIGHTGGVIGIPAQEWTQIMVKVQLAMQYERQAQQVYNQVQMIRMMAQNGVHLNEIPGFSQMIMGDIGGLRQMVQAGRS